MMNSERLLFVIESAAMHFGDGAARAVLRMLSYELRKEIQKELLKEKEHSKKIHDSVSKWNGPDGTIGSSGLIGGAVGDNDMKGIDHGDTLSNREEAPISTGTEGPGQGNG